MLLRYVAKPLFNYISFGTGGIKSNVSPLVAEQYTNKHAYVKKLKSGEEVIVTPQATIQKVNWNKWHFSISAYKRYINIPIKKFNISY